MSNEAWDAVKHLIAVKRRRAIALAYRDVLSMRGSGSTGSVLLTALSKLSRYIITESVGGRNFLDNQDFEILLRSSIFFFFFSYPFLLQSFFET